MTIRTRTLAMSTALVAGLTVAAPGAHAAPLPAEQAVVADLIGQVAVAAGPSRQVVALAAAQNNQPVSLWSVQRPAGGPIAPAQGIDAEPNVGFLNPAFLPGGEALAVWSRNTTGEQGAFASASGGAPFGLARLLPSAEARHDLAVDAAGRAVAIWNGFSGGANRVVRYATRAPGAGFVAGGDLTAPAAVTYTPQIASAPGGEVVAAWVRPSGGGVLIEATIGTTSAIPPAGAPVAAPTAADDVAVAIGPAGHAAVVWTDTGAVPAVRAAFREPGGAFGPPQNVSGGGQADAPSVVVDETGTATIAWAEAIGAQPSVVRVVSRAPGGALGEPVTVSGTGVSSSSTSAPQVVAGAGVQFVTWVRVDGASRLLEAARRPAGGSFGPPETLGTGALAFGTALEPGGNLAAAWTAAVDPSTDALLVGGLDTDRPAVSATVPPVAAAGVPQTMTTSASDWGGVASYAWDLGDGSTASGPSVTHSYAAAGARTVTLRVTDRAGNATVSTHPVTVLGTSLAGLDRRPPRATLVRVPRTVDRSTLARRGLGVRIRADEAATATVQMVGRARAATLQARGDVVLAARTVRLARARPRTVVLRPRAALLGPPRRAVRTTVRITLRDGAGNVRTLTRAVRVRGA